VGLLALGPFTTAEIDDARRMIVIQFGRMQRESRVGLYKSTACAIKIARPN